MTNRTASLQTRLTPDELAEFLAAADGASLNGGTALRVVVVAFLKRLRRAEGSFIEAIAKFDAEVDVQAEARRAPPESRARPVSTVPGPPLAAPVSPDEIPAGRQREERTYG